MTTLTILALAAAAAFGAYFWLRRAVAFAEAEAAPAPRAELRPTQHLDTQRLRAIPMPRPTSQTKSRTKVWEFVAPSGSCEDGRRRHGRRIELDLGTELPLHRCGLTECHCHYRPVADHRGGERRTGHERREELRFDASPDRRHVDKARRHLNTWTDAPTR